MTEDRTTPVCLCAIGAAFLTLSWPAYTSHTFFGTLGVMGGVSIVVGAFRRLLRKDQ